MKKFLVTFVSALVFLIGVSGANALVITDPAVTGSYGFATTNFSDEVIAVDAFDSNLGTLIQVDLVFTGSIDGTANAESLDAAPATIVLDIFGDIRLHGGPLTSDVTVLAAGSDSIGLAAFDGAIDFAGPSGISGVDLSGSAADSETITTNLSAFAIAGGGTLNFLLDATGSSSGSGAGNLITQFSTQARGDLSLVYTYRVTEVPEPTTILLFGAGLLGITGGIRRRNR